MSIGEAIQAARKKAGLTQVELGEKLGVSGSMIGQWENNLRKPKNETIQNIADALELGYLIDKCGEVHFYEFKDSPSCDLRPGQMQAVKAWAKDKRKTRLMTAYDQLNDTGQRIAVEQVEALTKQPELLQANTAAQPDDSKTDTDPNT